MKRTYPNVGSRSLEGLKNSIENSDYNEAIVFDNKVIGFVVCFQDNDLTKSYMKKTEHKNFKEISNRVDNCLLYTSPSPRDAHESRMPSSA